MFSSISKKIIGFAGRMRDMRFLGQVVFVIIVLLVSWSTAKAIQQNYELQRQIASLKKQNEIQRLKNDNLKIKNQYLNTDEYLELSARKQLGKAGKGETVVIIPKSTALKCTVASSVKTDTEVQQQVDEKKPSYQKNLEAWSQFFFRK